MNEKMKTLMIGQKIRRSLRKIIIAFMGALMIAIVGIAILTMNLAKYNASVILGIVVIALLVLAGIVSMILSFKACNSLIYAMLNPVEELLVAAQSLKEGKLDIEIEYEGEDEFGELADDLREACSQMNTVITDAGYLLNEMAKGNFNITTKAEGSYVGDFRALIEGMRTLNHQLDGTLRQISESSSQVKVGSEQLAQSAQALAEGATEQAGAIQELTATIENITNISEESAENANEAASTAKLSAENAKQNREEINELTGAMERITDTSKEIENIIEAIEDIASQTNLLSLNASIEAARAGEAGRGFAVVADQIGKLAADSAQSAVTTRELISKSLLEIEAGNKIVENTIAAINSVLVDMESFAEMATGSAEACRIQVDMLKQIVAGIEQISSVVQSNSASAEETSAVSEELSAQAITLEELVASFELRQN